MVPGDQRHPFGLRLHNEYLVEGVGVHYRQSACPHSKRGRDGQTLELEITYLLGQVSGALKPAEKLLDGDLPR
nr:hypothetical protein [Streptomyces atratus]